MPFMCDRPFGMAGAYAIIIAALMISLVLITQKSIFDMIRKFSRALYESAAKRQEKKERSRKNTSGRGREAGRTGGKTPPPQRENGS